MHENGEVLRGKKSSSQGKRRITSKKNVQIGRKKGGKSKRGVREAY